MRAHPAALLRSLVCLLLVTAIGPAVRPARAEAGQVWTVDRYGEDAADGDLAARHGSIRFVLENTQPGDIVRIGDIGPADAVFVTATLVVKPGVSVGFTRDEPCPIVSQPLLNLEALPALVNAPTVSMGAGATWRGVSISNASGYGGPRVAMKIVGADVDVCGTAFGQAYEPDGTPIEVVAPTLALGIEGPRAIIHRNLVKGAIVVGVTGDGARIGDAIGGSGEANSISVGGAVTVSASASDAARNVTIRDPFPRGLSGLVQPGVAGGDDIVSHANHWALTPSISSATSADAFATVELRGTASPHALVDIYALSGGVITRQAAVSADASGAFAYSGPLGSSGVSLFVGSTLNDPAYPARIGSSSALSASVAVVAGTPPPPGSAPTPRPAIWLPLVVRG